MTSSTPILSREPVRMPVWLGLALGALLAGLTAYAGSGDPLAGVIAALAVVTPGGIAVEVARGRAWSPTSTDLVVREAHELGAREIIDLGATDARALPAPPPADALLRLARRTDALQ